MKSIIIEFIFEKYYSLCRISVPKYKIAFQNISQNYDKEDVQSVNNLIIIY